MSAGVPLRSRGQYLSLEVPGLGEGRPSLLLGDRVVVSVAREEREEGGETYWEGFIHEVTLNTRLRERDGSVARWGRIMFD